MTAKKITLVRHGRPTVSLNEWVSGRSLCDFIDRYNEAGISESSQPPDASLVAIQTANKVFTSDYRRTIESAKRLQLNSGDSDPRFREVACWINFPWPWPIPAWMWLLLTRVLWPMALIQAPESYRQAQTRAAQAAKFLVQQSQDSSHIILVGHGGFNTLIARELQALGWQGLKQPRLSHWGATTYTQPLPLE